MNSKTWNTETCCFVFKVVAYYLATPVDIIWIQVKKKGRVILFHIWKKHQHN